MWRLSRTLRPSSRSSQIVSGCSSGQGRYTTSPHPKAKVSKGSQDPLDIELVEDNFKPQFTNLEERERLAEELFGEETDDPLGLAAPTPAPKKSNDKASIERKKETAVMTQYNRFKKEYPNFLLMFMLGDFYEMFNEDAKRASEILEITLTKRRNETPMCGFPIRSLDANLIKLIKEGVNVAVCDQVSSAKKGSLIERKITRLITPGTITEDEFLNAKKSNYLLSIKLQSKFQRIKDHSSVKIGLAWAELSTGDIFVASSTVGSLESDLARIGPSEVLCQPELLSLQKELVEILRNYPLDTEVHKAFKLDRVSEMFPKFDVQTLEELEAESLESLLGYIDETQRGKLPIFAPPKRFTQDKSMYIDASTRLSLELFLSHSEKKGSVLSVIDKTVTGVGGRLLASRLNAPSLSLPELNERLDLVQFFYDNYALVKPMRDLLGCCYDIERCLQRLTLGRGGPRDLHSIAITDEYVKKISEQIRKFQKGYGFSIPNGLKSILAHVDEKELEILSEIKQAIKENPPISDNEGDFIADGYSPRVDHLRKLKTGGEEEVVKLLEKYRRDHVIALKLKATKSRYFFEVSKSQEPLLKSNPIFKFHQQYKNALCYTTDDLEKLVYDIATASMSVVIEETEIFQSLTKKLLEFSEYFKNVAHAIAVIDVSTALAELAHTNNYVRPKLEDSYNLAIKNGRHPTVESAQSAISFVPNDCELKEGDVWLITGANMGGKSTFLRQNALIVILAQAGSFVPADEAVVGLVDAVFSRVGASDDISRNRSTFMVEMLETSHILKHATNRSLLVMDEIGRGTSPTDGIAIAQAIIEYIHEHKKSRTLFATHFHELSDLTNLDNLRYFSMSVHLEKKLTFLHRVVPGNSPSYGVEVFGLVPGIPQEVIQRAFSLRSNLLAKSESDNLKIADNLPYFVATNEVRQKPRKLEEIEDFLNSIDVSNITPKDAINFIFELKEKVSKE